MNVSTRMYSRSLGWMLVLLVVAGLPGRSQVMRVTAEKPVTVETVSVKTEVTGRVAVTTFDLTFRNTNPRILEGTFEFPLLGGQTVVRFALDVNGALREAVPIEKDRGRIVFEEVERRRVDPGLLEQTAGNNYRARVYPIPANGTRRIVIAYQEDIATRHGHYRLPLNFVTPVKSFRLELDVLTGAREPAQVTTTLPLSLPEWEEDRRMVVTRTDFSAKGVIELELPPTKVAPVITGKRAGDSYFFAEVPITTKPLARPRPRIVGLIWDASASGASRDHAREFALLDAWFSAVPDVEVRFVIARHEAAAPVTLSVKAGDWSELRRRLETLVYDGATGLDGVNDDVTVDEWLWFSDGLVNFGQTRDLHLSRPLNAIASAVSADHVRLRRMAERTGGIAVDLLQQDAPTALARLRSKLPRVQKVERNPEQMAEVYPLVNSVVEGDRVIVTGRLLAPSAKLQLRVGHEPGTAETIDLTVEAGKWDSDLAPRAWAATKIDALAGDMDRIADVRRTAQAFGIVTSDTSLIVLETVADYVRYDVEPPTELKEEWQRLRGSVEGVGNKAGIGHLDRVVAQFEERITWWKRNFPKGDRPIGEEKKPKREQEGFVSAAPQIRVRQQESERAGGASQPVPSVGTITADDEGNQVVALTPFSVQADPDQGYSAANTLAGSRTNVSLADIGGAVTFAGHGGPPSTRLATSAKPEAGADTGAVAGATIALKPWLPDAAYLERLASAPREERYAIYLEERPAHREQPGFFLDVSDWLARHDDRALGLLVLSNLAELQLDSPAVLRVLAQRLVEMGEHRLARPLLEEVLRLRPEEPQSLRDLALVCAALKEYQRAVDLLWRVAEKSWDARFPNIEGLALTEMNAIISTCGQTLDISRIDHRLLTPMPVGLRVVLTWDADATDIDLWVDDPSGERAMYSHPQTYQGGRMSSDFTGGYGPEEFILRDPKPGKYVVRLHYFGDRRQTAIGPITAQAKIITDFGLAGQKEKLMTVRLAKSSEELEVGTIEIEQ